jgi:tetratricopeptide (TPR) repeat protein
MKIRQIVTILAILTMIVICVLPIAAAETAVPEPTQIPDLATQNFNRAERALSNGEFETALWYFNQTLRENTTLIGMGDALMFTYKDKSGVLTELGRYDEAIATAEEGLAVYTKEPGLWNNKGYAYSKMGKYTEAADAYSHAVSVNSTYLKGWLNLGDVLVKTGRGSEAVNAYTRALELDPGNTAATAGLENAKKLSGPENLTTLALIAVVVIAAGLVIWYMKFRKTTDEKTPGKVKSKK